VRDLHQRNKKSVPHASHVVDKAREMYNVAQQVPRAIIDEVASKPLYAPKEGEWVVLLASEDDETATMRYARYERGRYKLAWLDAFASPHLTGDETDAEEDEVQEVVVWQKKHDVQIAGPVESVFPRPDGWLLDKGKTSLQLTIKECTRALAMRKFKAPACEKKWDGKFQAKLPWKKVWRQRAFYTAPRDQVTFSKVIHRTIWTRRNEGCVICGAAYENTQHLVTCQPVSDHFWEPTIKLLEGLGMAEGLDKEQLLLTGTIGDGKVVSRNLFGILEIAWRCINAERTKAMMEEHQADPAKAYERLLSLLMTRLRADGARWARWIEVGRFQTPSHVIPLKARDKGVISIGGDTGRDPAYAIARPILQEAVRLGLMRADELPDQEASGGQAAGRGGAAAGRQAAAPGRARPAVARARPDRRNMQEDATTREDPFTGPSYAAIRATYLANHGDYWWYNDHLSNQFSAECRALNLANA
jgi:hypothetical protein